MISFIWKFVFSFISLACLLTLLLIQSIISGNKEARSLFISYVVFMLEMWGIIHTTNEKYLKNRIEELYQGKK